MASSFVYLSLLQLHDEAERQRVKRDVLEKESEGLPSLSVWGRRRRRMKSTERKRENEDNGRDEEEKEKERRERGRGKPKNGGEEKCTKERESTAKQEINWATEIRCKKEELVISHRLVRCKKEELVMSVDFHGRSSLAHVPKRKQSKEMGRKRSFITSEESKTTTTANTSGHSESSGKLRS